MKVQTRENLLEVAIILLVFLAGFFTATAIKEATNVQGFYVRNWNISDIEQLVEVKPRTNIKEKLDNFRGQWVCVDLNDIKEPKRQIEVCAHEVGHHYFRENCGDNCGDKDSESLAEVWEGDIAECIYKNIY